MQIHKSPLLHNDISIINSSGYFLIVDEIHVRFLCDTAIAQLISRDIW